MIKHLHVQMPNKISVWNIYSEGIQRSENLQIFSFKTLLDPSESMADRYI